MGQKSRIKDLPEWLVEELNRLIREDRESLDAIYDYLASRVDNPPSRSSIWRYASKEKQASAALRENREIVKVFAQELGPESVESEQGRILVEMMRSLAFKAMVGKVSNPEYSYDAKEMGQIARSIRDLSQAMHLEQDFAKRIREEERRKVEAEMKDRMQKELGTAEELKQMTHEELLRKIAELTAAESA